MTSTMARVFCTLVFLKLVCICHLEKVQKAVTQPPNVVLLVADDLGYGDLGYSGHPTSKTPHLDKLAENGRFFSNFYVTSPVCSPSRASILTGRYQVRSGVYPGTFTPDSYLGLPRNETTLAQLLKRKGYMTQMVGKWHLGVGYNSEYLPTNFGFDDYFGIPYSHDMCPCKYCFPNNGRCLSRCWDQSVSCPLYNETKIHEQPTSLPELTDKLLKRSLSFIHEAKNQPSPFFLYHSFHHIHHPQYASSRYHGTSDRGPTGDALSELDWSVGEIIRTLAELKLLDDTLIIFTSDNGPSLCRHTHGGSAGLLRCGKGTTMDGGIRVPAIVYWHNHIPKGKTTALTSAMDIFPTIAKLVDAKIPNSLILDGIDFSAVLENSTSLGNRSFLAVYPEAPERKIGPYAILYKQYKAHFYTKGSSLSDDSNFDLICTSSHKLTKHDPPLLYNLFEDPSERYDIGKHPEYRKVVKLMTEWRDQHMNTTEWIQSRTLHRNKNSEPCCTNSHCTPFPSCCDCPQKYSHTIEVPRVFLG